MGHFKKRPKAPIFLTNTETTVAVMKAQYYRGVMQASAFNNTIEIMNGMTDHSFSSLYREPKSAHSRAYLPTSMPAGPSTTSIFQTVPSQACSAREYLFGKRTEQKELMELAAGDCRITQDPL